jgi:hypothetical protein
MPRSSWSIRARQCEETVVVDDGPAMEPLRWCTHIPILGPEKIAETRLDYVLIRPWNVKDAITAQLAFCRSWGAKFVVPVPEVSII